MAGFSLAKGFDRARLARIADALVVYDCGVPALVDVRDSHSIGALAHYRASDTRLG
jgi:hypothetical protein